MAVHFSSTMALEWKSATHRGAPPGGGRCPRARTKARATRRSRRMLSSPHREGESRQGRAAGEGEGSVEAWVRDVAMSIAVPRIAARVRASWPIWLRREGARDSWRGTHSTYSFGQPEGSSILPLPRSR